MGKVYKRVESLVGVLWQHLQVESVPILRIIILLTFLETETSGMILANFFSLSIVFNFKTARENWPSNVHRKNYFSHFCNQFKTGTNALLKQKKGNLFSSSSSPLSFYFYLWVKTKCDEIIIEQNWKRACPLASLIIKCYMKSFFFFLDKYNTIFIHFNSF